MTRSFQRKIVLLVLIAALLVPLSLVGRPATTSAGDDADVGGRLARLREELKAFDKKASGLLRKFQSVDRTKRIRWLR